MQEGIPTVEHDLRPGPASAQASASWKASSSPIVLGTHRGADNSPVLRNGRLDAFEPEWSDLLEPAIV
jgi:hypothetical protein